MKQQNSVVKNAARRVLTKPGFSASEICDIVVQCKKSGVARLSYNGLELHFVNQKIEESTEPGPLPVVNPVGIPTFSEETDREEYLAELLLTNPAAYEQELEKEAYTDGENNKATQSVSRRS